MVNPFQFSRLPKIIFKKGSFSDLPSVSMQFGNSAIIVTGRKSFIKSEAAEKLFWDLASKNISYTTISIPTEPTPEMIDEAVKELRQEGFSLVIGIGGGSVLDAGKAISAMIPVKDPVIDYLEGVGTRQHPGTKLPFIAVPTTSGTGSEATKNAVISRTGQNGFKRSLRHDNFVPDVAIIDPLLTVSCTKEITAAGGMDCFTQLVEAYLSDKANPYTDALAIEGLKAVRNSLPECYNNGENTEARGDMSFAALTSGICLANAGLGVVHGFASSVGGLYDIPHGLICGTLMAKANQVNIKALRKNNNNLLPLKKYAQLGMLFLQGNGKSDDYYIDGFSDYIETLSEKLNLTRLNLSGSSIESNIESICSVTELKNNPVILSKDELIEILTSVV
jgi:alcohol dehydrogenase class IV